MDILSLASPYAAIVGLVGTFMSGRKQGESIRLQEFLEWLTVHGHSEIKNLIESNHRTTIGVKAMVEEGQAELVARLGAIERLLATMSLGLDAFEDVAISLYPDSRLSDQAIDILVAFEVSAAGRALERKSYEGTSLHFLDVNAASVKPSEPRFFEDDLGSLLSSGLLRPSHNGKGERIFNFTREASQLARRHIEKDSARR